MSFEDGRHVLDAHVLWLIKRQAVVFFRCNMEHAINVYYYTACHSIIRYITKQTRSKRNVECIYECLNCVGLAMVSLVCITGIQLNGI